MNKMNQMKQRLLVAVMLLMLGIVSSYAQQGFLKGKVTDKITGEELVGAAVVVDGTTVGTITNFMGEFVMPPLDAGTYTIKVQYISYDPQTFTDIVITEGEEKTLNVQLAEATMDIAEVAVVAKANRESETILLLDQKKAEVIVESIGAKQLSSMGVSNASSATAKISGVTKNEGSGDIYIRGLGDRYLSTTMNELPIPSDDVEKKNIDLNMFSTDVIKFVGVGKTYSSDKYGDISSANVNVVSKSFSDKISVGFKTGSSTNVLKSATWNNFKATQNYENLSFGIYNSSYDTRDAIQNQSWNTVERKLPINYELSFTGGKKFKLNNKNLTVFATASHSKESAFLEGVFQRYRMNANSSKFTDAQTFKTNINTTGLLNIGYEFNENNNINLNSLVVLKTVDELYESGRNEEGYVRDQDPKETEAFVRDQNLKTTQMFINQIIGINKLGEKNEIKWALGYNKVIADEPNRIRNEVNVYDNGVLFSYVGDYQQKKSFQNINDNELNGYIKDQIKFIDQKNKKLKLNIGANFRQKNRDFEALSIGVRAKGDEFLAPSIDNLDFIFLNKNLYGNSSTTLRIREGLPDIYEATLGVYAGYFNLSFLKAKLSGTFGMRYEIDNIDVDWDVTNYVGRTGSTSKAYNNLLPALNIKYNISDKNALRFAASKTVTLPEFKELAPFEYVSPTGRVTKGNPDLKNSENYNIDLKWELYPNAKSLVSLTSFYKIINDPINRAQTRGSSGYFYYANTGEKADVYGLEFETKFDIIKASTSESPNLKLLFNATRMWFTQDLKDEFQYNSKKETDLQGAASFICNGTLSYTNNKKNKFVATLSANYSSDKVFALGAPESFTNSETLFNNEIIENGFVTVDMVLSKKISERISIKFSGKNLLNPSIEQTQIIEPTEGITTTEIVESYKKGINLSLGVKINLN